MLRAPLTLFADKSQVRPVAGITIFLFARLVTLLTPFAQLLAFALLRVFGCITIVLDGFFTGITTVHTDKPIERQL
jgi:hypothetical protein